MPYFTKTICWKLVEDIFTVLKSDVIVGQATNVTNCRLFPTYRWSSRSLLCLVLPDWLDAAAAGCTRWINMCELRHATRVVRQSQTHRRKPPKSSVVHLFPASCLGVYCWCSSVMFQFHRSQVQSTKITLVPVCRVLNTVIGGSLRIALDSTFADDWHSSSDHSWKS